MAAMNRAAEGALVRQLVRRHVLGIVDAAHDDWLIPVAFQKGDDDLPADPRQVDGAEPLAGGNLTHANPARAVRVLFTLTVPVELHFDPAVLVAKDFLARRTRDN